MTCSSVQIQKKVFNCCLTFLVTRYFSTEFIFKFLLLKVFILIKLKGSTCKSSLFTLLFNYVITMTYSIKVCLHAYKYLMRHTNYGLSEITGLKNAILTS